MSDDKEPDMHARRKATSVALAALLGLSVLGCDGGAEEPAEEPLQDPAADPEAVEPPTEPAAS